MHKQTGAVPRSSSAPQAPPPANFTPGYPCPNGLRVNETPLSGYTDTDCYSYKVLPSGAVEMLDDLGCVVRVLSPVAYYSVEPHRDM